MVIGVFLPCLCVCVFVSHCVASCVPVGYSVVQVLGFLEELVVNNDPEYKVPV